jgi:hypothetical protein
VIRACDLDDHSYPQFTAEASFDPFLGLIARSRSNARALCLATDLSPFTLIFRFAKRSARYTNSIWTAPMSSILMVSATS